MVIRFPSASERAGKDKSHTLSTHSGLALEAKVMGLTHAGRRQKPRFTRQTRTSSTHSGRVLEAKVLGLAHAGKRQKPRFTTRARD